MQTLHPVGSSFVIEEISEGHSTSSRSTPSDGVKSSQSKVMSRSSKVSPEKEESRSAWQTPRTDKLSSTRQMSSEGVRSVKVPSPESPSGQGESTKSPLKIESKNSDPQQLTPEQDENEAFTPSQLEALDSLKEMMGKEKLSSFQARTLESIRQALQQINDQQENLTNQQLERTLTVISLASQLTEESLHLGVFPDSIFETFAVLNSRAMSEMTHGEDDYSFDDNLSSFGTTAEFLRPITKMSIRDEVC